MKSKRATWFSSRWFVVLLLLGEAPLNAESDSGKSTPSSHSKDIREIVAETIRVNLVNRTLSSSRNAAWQIIHGAVAYGKELPLEVNGQRVEALDFIFNGGTVRGWDVSMGDPIPNTQRHGIKVMVEQGSYVGQGHPDQWLGYLSQVQLPLETVINVHGENMTLRDMALPAQWDVPNNPYLEYSWTLIALTNYFPDVKEWTASDGKTWTLEPLVEFEAKQDLGSSACGGMHRLMGLAHAVKYRERQKELLNGPWSTAKKVVDASIQSAKEFQNTDGSFSTNYTRRPGNSVDLSLSLSATGHTLEFLAYALEKKELSEAWMERAVLRLCAMLKASQNIDLECGGLYHALAGLRLYQKRRFELPD